MAETTTRAKTRTAGSTAWLLGAGFSRQVHAGMPMMHELGEAVRGFLALDRGLLGNLGPNEQQALADGQVPLGDVELFLTSLLSDQPYFSLRERYARKAVAAAVASFVFEFVGDAQRQAMEDPAPKWLESLIAQWHHGSDTVLSLNYDTLIEHAVMSYQLFGYGDVSHGPRAMTNAITRGYPLEVIRKGLFGGETWPRPCFRLIKLHGSLSWRRMSGTREVRQVLEAIGAWGDEAPGLPDDLEPHLIGSEPALLLPQADKSSGYQDPSISNLWTAAREHLERCEELILFGYSLPKSDTSVPALLFQALERGLPVTIVDPNAPAVRANLRSAGLTANGQDVDPINQAELSAFLNERAKALALSTNWDSLRDTQRPWFVETVSVTNSKRPFIHLEDEPGAAALTLVVDEKPLAGPGPYRSNFGVEHGPPTGREWRFRVRGGRELYPMSVRREGANTGTNVTVEVIPAL